jgi:site-specific recombinase XerD
MQMNEAGDEFFKGYFATNSRREKTKTAYYSDLKQFQKFVGAEIKISQLSGSHIESWAAHLQEEEYSPASIRRKIIVLKIFCSYWVRNGVLAESPFWRIKLSYGRTEQLPRTLTEREMRGLLKQAQREYSKIGVAEDVTRGKSAPAEKASSIDYRKLRNLALIELLFATGMRVGEVSAVDIKDFLAKEGTFKVQGKGGRERLAFIVDQVTRKVQIEHLEARSKIKTESTALFLNASGKRLSPQGIANIILQLRQAGGIERHITPHMLRHTVATMLLRNGLDIRIVQEFLGHASIATTQRYTHISKEHMVRELKKRHPSLTIRD